MDNRLRTSSESKSYKSIIDLQHPIMFGRLVNSGRDTVTG